MPKGAAGKGAAINVHHGGRTGNEQAVPTAPTVSAVPAAPAASAVPAASANIDGVVPAVPAGAAKPAAPAGAAVPAVAAGEGAAAYGQRPRQECIAIPARPAVHAVPTTLTEPTNTTGKTVVTVSRGTISTVRARAPGNPITTVGTVGADQTGERAAVDYCLRVCGDGREYEQTDRSRKRDERGGRAEVERYVENHNKLVSFQEKGTTPTPLFGWCAYIITQLNVV